MPNSLSPAFVKLEYTSDFGPHVALLPLRAAPAFDPDPSLTTIENWALANVNLEDMITTLVNAMADFYTPADAFTLYSVFTQLTATADPVFRETLRFATPIVGTSASTTWRKASQLTATFRTSLGGISKLVMLDALSFNLWDIQVDPTGSADLIALINEWTQDISAWAGRDGGQPTTFLQLTKTLNEKLRKAYRMT